MPGGSAGRCELSSLGKGNERRTGQVGRAGEEKKKEVGSDHLGGRGGLTDTRHATTNGPGRTVCEEARESFLEGWWWWVHDRRRQS